jgi:hypothetical protein
MLNLIAAALAVAQPSVPADAQAQHAQHQQAGQKGHEQHGQMAKMGKECCCKEMMEKMRSGHDVDRKQGHQEHGGE